MNAVRTRFCSNCHQLTTSSLSAVINCLSPSVVSPPLPVIITRWHPTFLCGNDRAGGLLPSRTIQELSGCHSIAPDLSVQWWLAVKAYFTGVDKTSISGEVCVGFTFLRTVRSPRHPHCLLPECAEPSPAGSRPCRCPDGCCPAPGPGRRQRSAMVIRSALTAILPTGGRTRRLPRRVGRSQPWSITLAPHQCRRRLPRCVH